MSTTMRIMLVVALALVAFVLVMGPAAAQTGTGTATATATAMRTATPATLPTTGGVTGVSSLTVVLLALGASAGLGGLLLRGLRQPR